MEKSEVSKMTDELESHTYRCGECEHNNDCESKCLEFCKVSSVAEKKIMKLLEAYK